MPAANRGGKPDRIIIGIVMTPVDTVVAGLFDLAEKLYGIRLEQQSGVRSRHALAALGGAALAGLDRLEAFQQAIENSFCCGASIDLLLIGLDTDTDAIRVHIPDAAGELELDSTFRVTALLRHSLAPDAEDWFEVIAAGDRAAITTRDGAQRSILVHIVDDEFVRGYEASHVADGMPPTAPDVDIAIDDIVHLEVAGTKTDIPDIDKPYVLYVILFGVVSIVAAYLSIF